jgi:hypothetical protein
MARGEPTVGEGLQSSLVGTSPRTDGTTQVTYKGTPLYRFAGDAKAGDTKGQGLNKVWWEVRLVLHLRPRAGPGNRNFPGCAGRLNRGTGPDRALFPLPVGEC